MVKNDEKKKKNEKKKPSKNVKKNATNLLLIKHTQKIHYRDKADKCPTSRFSPFHCCLGVVKLGNGAYPENSFTCGVLS